jgi:hypothetical protein
MHESFCLLKHVINPRLPRTAKLEVRFPTAKNSFPALFWTLLITLYCYWPSRRRKGWHETVSGFINSIECADVVNNTQITVKTVMRLIKDKIKCTCGLEYRPVSIAIGNAPVLKSVIVRLAERGMLDSTNCSAFTFSLYNR